MFEYFNTFYNCRFTYDIESGHIHITTPNFPDCYYDTSDDSYHLMDSTPINSPELNSYYDNEIAVVLYRSHYPEE